MRDAAARKKLYRFDQLAEQINDRVDNPAESGVERYIGLEHLDADSLRIRRWGSITDVESTKLRFQPGDIIFGKRRVYQRKLAVADFEGICSAHAMVLRAKPDVVLPEFLPFFMQSDHFMERALEISVGSLSPTINWKTLAAEKFALPPIEEQQRIVDLLLSLETTRESIQAVINAALSASRSMCSEHFKDYLGSTFLVKEVAEHVSKGESPKWQGFDYVDHGVPFITSEHVLDGVLCHDGCKKIPQAFHNKLQRSRIQPYDVLITLVGASIGRAAVVPNTIDEANTNQAVAVVRFNRAAVIPEYFVQWYLHSATQQHVTATLVNTARANVSLTDVRNLLMPVPPIEAQMALVSRTAALRQASLDARERITALDEIRHHIMRQMSDQE